MKLCGALAGVLGAEGVPDLPVCALTLGAEGGESKTMRSVGAKQSFGNNGSHNSEWAPLCAAVS